MLQEDLFLQSLVDTGSLDERSYKLLIWILKSAREELSKYTKTRRGRFASPNAPRAVQCHIMLVIAPLKW